MTEFTPDPSRFEQLQAEASDYFANYQHGNSSLVVRAFMPLRTTAKPGVLAADRTLAIGDVVYQPYYGQALSFDDPANQAILDNIEVVHAGIQMVETLAPADKVRFNTFGFGAVEPETPVFQQHLELPLGVVSVDGSTVLVYDQQRELRRVNGSLFNDEDPDLAYNPYLAIDGLELDVAAQMNGLLIWPWARANALFASQAEELGLVIDPSEHIWREV